MLKTTAMRILAIGGLVAMLLFSFSALSAEPGGFAFVSPQPTPYQEPGLPPPPAKPTPVPPGYVSGNVTPDGGGVIDAYKENVRITFPAGLLGYPVNFVYQVVQPPAGTAPKGGSLLYFTLDAFGPNGNRVTQFNKSFEICAKGVTGLSYWDGKQWIDLPVTPSADGVCANLDHLTLFAVVVIEKPASGTGGAPGAAGPVATPETPTVPTVLAATPAKSGLPTSLPATGDNLPWVMLVGFATVVLLFGFVLRRQSRS